MNLVPTARQTTDNRANVCVLQPAGYVHSLGLVDPARYLAHQLGRLGVPTTLTKNRLHRSAVNYVFGAHLGFDVEANRDVQCVIVNLEQLGRGGAKLPVEYLQLLRSHQTVDYHRDNPKTYSAHPDDVPLLTFGYADYLSTQDQIPLRERPIDLLFLGSINERRKSLIAQIEATGVQVAVFDTPLYGPERDHFIRQAKAVVNLAFYESARFEQVRAFFTLSCGTPLISERRGALTGTESAFENSVLWFEPRRQADFFGGYFGSDQFYLDAEVSLQTFRNHDPLPAFAAVWARDSALVAGVPTTGVPTTGQVHAALEIDGYRQGWLNLAAQDQLKPDAVVDLSEPLVLPLALTSDRWGSLTLHPDTVSELNLGFLAPWTPKLTTWMSNALTLLRDGGELTLHWPTGTDASALEPFTSRFWASGWLEHRFDVVRFNPVDATGRPCPAAQAGTVAVTLRKVESSPWERTISRSQLQELRF
jgi:hypothetical protein